MPNAQNKNNGRKSAPEQSQTVIIPKISPEMLEQARRAAQNPSSAGYPTATGVFDTDAVRTTPADGQTPASAPAEKPKPEKQPKAAPKPPSSQEEAQRRLWQSVHDNHLWLNNPVIMRGLGLAPVVVAAFNAQNALMLCVAALLLLTPTRMLSVAICHLTGNRFRPVIYCYAAALLYIPTYILLFHYFGTDLAALGIYLPVLVVEPVIIKRMENDTLETVGEALHRGLNNTAGFCLVLLLTGGLRELLSDGTLFGNTVFHAALLPLAGEPAGGFILLGVVAAFWTAIANSYVYYKQQEVKRNYANRRR